MSDEHKSGTLENWASGGSLEIKILRQERDRLASELVSVKEENISLRTALAEFADHVDEELLLDEDLEQAWGRLKSRVDTVRVMLKSPSETK
jgi:hypothetical protein